MRKLTQILGWVGLVGVLVGFFNLILSRRLNLFIELHLAVGGLLLLVGFLFNFARVERYLRKSAGKAQTSGYLLLILLLIAILALGFIVYQHNWMLDITKDKLYTLSDKTKEVLKNLPGEIKILAFFPSEGYEKEESLLELYARATDKLKIKYIDPDRHPELAEAHSVNQYGTVIFDYQGRKTRITRTTEERITNSLIKITSGHSWIIYFITGHGEADPEQKDKGGYSLLKQYLEDENFQVKKLKLGPEGVPEDARLVIVAGPRAPYQPAEVIALDRYIGKGGDIIFLLDPLVPTNLEGLLKSYGIELLNGVVIDPVNYLVGMDAVGLSPVTDQFGKHEITRELEGKLLVFPRARALKVVETPEIAGEWTPLVFSSEKSFLETDLQSLFKYGKIQKDPQDLPGPLLIAAVYQEYLKPKPWERIAGKHREQIRMVVVGNSHFMRNMALEVYSNFIFALDCINWAVGEQELVTLRPKKRSASRIFITRRQTQLIFYISVLVIPELLIIIGIVVWWRKK